MKHHYTEVRARRAYPGFHNRRIHAGSGGLIGTQCEHRGYLLRVCLRCRHRYMGPFFHLSCGICGWKRNPPIPLPILVPL